MRTNFEIERREALKRIGVGGGLLLGGGVSLEAHEQETLLSHPSTKKHARIVVIGAGTAGMIAAARIRRAAPNAQIVMIAPDTIHRYQSGALFVAAGMATSAEYRRPTDSLLPDGVEWLRERVVAFDPANNMLTAEKSGKVVYDILVVTLGAEYDYEAIEGLHADMIGKEGIASIYMDDTVGGDARGADATRVLFEQIRSAAPAAGKPLKVLFSEPRTPIKGRGSALSLMMLYNHMLKREGAQGRVTFDYMTAHTRLLELEAFDGVLKKELKKHINIEAAYGKELVAVDAGAKKATFVHNGAKEEIAYDLLHVTPPLRAPQVMRDSPLAVQDGVQKGWMAVDPATLRHPDYGNVFGLGDVIALPYAKSGGAAQHQGIILQDNIAAALEGEKLTFHYDGYTVSPVVTAYGKVLLAEYNTQNALPTFFLNPYEPRVAWWLLQRYFMPWAYFNLLMRGMM